MIDAPWNLLGVSRDIATQFLGVFARFEYALKAAGFVMAAGWAKPDWSQFGRASHRAFNRHASPALEGAVTYLLQSPPQVQTVRGNVLSWGPLQLSAGSELENLVLCVKTVRNNLFHGGKFLPNPNDPARDTRLVEASLVVLEEALNLDPNVAGAFSA